MAIQEVEISKASVTKGFTRELEASALNQIMDNTMIGQYTKPEESTIRELTANAIDSQTEKMMAISILNGTNKVSDYFIERDGAQYEDSRFDKSYYDLNNLDTVNNEALLNYRENVSDTPNLGYCDVFEVIDHGVGLGVGSLVNRLEKYFKIGASSKRNNNQSLGAFGVGNKVSLSLRNDYYTMETVHNGKLFRFNCYARKIVPLINKIKNDFSGENESITFESGDVVYYEASDSKNYTKISVPTKKIHRDRFREAIKKQLLYFTGVKFTYFNNEYGTEVEEIDFKATVLYNSENIIVSDNRIFNKPHIIITKNNEKGSVGVCYGYIDFPELEMETIYGNVGIKCPIRSVYEDKETGKEVVVQEGVTVNQSRESIVWDDTTKVFIKNQFLAATVEATALVEEQLQEPDFLKWITKSAQVISSVDNSSVLGKLVRIVNTENLKPKYSVDTSIQYAGPMNLFEGLKVRKVRKTYNGDIERDVIKRWSDFTNRRLYLKTIGTSKATDLYLTQTTSDFVIIEQISDDIISDNFLQTTRYNAKSNSLDDAELKTWSDKEINKILTNRNKIYQLITDSEDILNYDDVVVPEAFSILADSVDEKNKLANMTPAELRVINEEIVCYTLTEAWTSYNNGVTPYKKAKEEPKVKDIKAYTGELYYATTEDAYKLHMAALLIERQMESKFYGEDIQLVQVSKGNVKHFKDHKHIDRFFATYDENNVKTMNSKLVKWNTARLIDDSFNSFEFLNNFKLFNNDMVDLFVELRTYKEANYTNERFNNYNPIDEKGTDFRKLVTGNLDAMNDLQLFIRDNAGDDKAISQKLQDVLATEDVDPEEKYVGLDLSIYDKLQELITFVDPINALLNSISALTDEYSTISPELESSIKQFLELKNR